jgi:hypothetical protein
VPTRALLPDHGTTLEGNHGGATAAERDVGLFAFASEPMRVLAEEEDGVVAQVDIAPTLATALALPLPAHSAGRLLPSLLPRRVPQQRTACLVEACALLCAVLCCAVLCRAVLCCAVLCCAVLCCAVRCLTPARARRAPRSSEPRTASRWRTPADAHTPPPSLLCV